MCVRKRVSVKVPAGMDEGNVLRLKGLGNAGVQGGPSGDLVLRFQVRQVHFAYAFGGYNSIVWCARVCMSLSEAYS
jgi:DnaJ-class molecular chaperone